ncbi:MAG: hypothetical protein KJO36_09835, partial [Acidimicrobiia bacterium]|nr:hypothetical protein [Acidimicrobiia bacterium]
MPPTGHSAWDNPYIIPCARRDLSSFGGTIAGAVVSNKVRDITQPTSQSECAVIPQGATESTVGDGSAILIHPDDAVADDLGTVGNPPIAANVFTGFFANGLAEAKTWMDDFIAEYERRQDIQPEENIPDIGYAIFDTEKAPVTYRDFTIMGTVIDAMMNDGRWTSETTIPGFGGDSWSTLMSREGVTFNNTKSLSHADNQAFTRWYQRMIDTAIDAVMDEGFYQKLRTAFPGCVCSNYRDSAAADNGGSGTRIIEFRFPYDSWFYWHKFSAPVADRSSGVMYVDKGPLGWHRETGLAADHSFTNATWTQSTQRLTVANEEFAAYKFSSNDKVNFSSGTG